MNANDVRPVVQTVVSPPFMENAYIASLPNPSDCLIMDPSFDTDSVVEDLTARQLTPAAILNTHGHLDHIAGNRALKDRWPDCPIVICDGDAYKLLDNAANLSAQYAMEIVSPKADVQLRHGDTYEA